MTDPDALVAFIEERLADEARIAQEAQDDRESDWWWSTEAESPGERYVAAHDPQWALDDITGKRAVLAAYRSAESPPMIALGRLLAQLLAWPYRRHPDWHPEWAPRTSVSEPASSGESVVP